MRNSTQPTVSARGSSGAVVVLMPDMLESTQPRFG
ncbi:MAG: hypothetical protein AVDCRST_MAG67-1951 [uncultured Solirubrobacteraceae bacterium]|uniref:Uncharacterized protein n=1 Tax=uncultured Solirubrobacteraceae bacterium TaxID=1162706 RepID=A0A6J4SPE0_9ACTN|nr:MAG: hypothetical protein AVDCRST_MAG67-1951 [uncultured Solirubrobacteraceae bacterium]